MPFLLPDTPESNRLGGKGAALARLARLGFDVPPWFAVTPQCAWQDHDLLAALADIGPGPYAVRSSGSSEDGSSHSFAGQFESHLHVPANAVPDRIHAVRLSSHSEPILTYCRENNIPAPDTPTVLVQRMIHARCAGVAFSADPVSGQRGVTVVSAVPGTGDKLVSGEVDGEDWRIADDHSILSQPDHPLVLTESSAREVAALAIRCEQACSRPQDIEWAIDENGTLWLLQSRPITTLAGLPDPDDELHVWDNSNIAESYGGVTTPLTFSFARRIYESVYREFCALMSVPRTRIDRADDVFPKCSDSSAAACTTTSSVGTACSLCSPASKSTADSWNK
jgi:rifampicin phosphotransferase